MNFIEFINPYELKFEERPGYLYASVTGEMDSYDISRLYWQEISAECSRLNCKKILVDENIKEPIPSLTEIFRGAAERQHMGFSGIKIAFVDRYADHHEKNLFAELVATNRGLFCKVFSNFEEGEKWLLSD